MVLLNCSNCKKYTLKPSGSSGFLTWSFLVLFDSGALSSAGVAVGFVIAAANRVILQRADTIRYWVFNTLLGCTCAGKPDKK